MDENSQHNSAGTPNLETMEMVSPQQIRSAEDEQTKSNGDEIERKGFTSENFKIEINGLPRFFGVGEAKKLFKKLNLKAHKFKPVGGRNAKYMFVNFANEDDKIQAIAKLDGLTLKGTTLKAFPANAAKDPLLKHRSNNFGQRNPEIVKTEDAENDKSAEDRIAEAVSPLWYTHPLYGDQLKQKLDGVKRLVHKLEGEFHQQLPFLSSCSHLHTENSKRSFVVVDDIVPSPVITGYRNKCEFSIGKHPETGETVVGFRLASYKRGSIAVVGIDHLPQVSDSMKKVVKHFQDLVQHGEAGWKLDAYDQVTQQGYWRQLTLRSSRSGNLMAVVVLHPQRLTDVEKELVKSNIIAHFEKLNNTTMQISSLHIQFLGQKEKGSEDPPVELLSGSDTISETLMKGRLTFQISPQSFFQVNVEAAENLYEVCGQLAGLEERNIKDEVDSAKPLPTTLFDVCCGTGTIGLCLANRCNKVIGVDCVVEAIENANNNAQRNGLSNAEFHAGRAEFILGQLIKNEASEGNQNRRLVAIVDPPRAGLHPKAVTALRAATEIHTLIYVCCDAKAAMQSLINLGKPPSNTYRGDPFIPRRVVPVDLFPHTPHIEIVIMFERMPLIEMASKEENMA